MRIRKVLPMRSKNNDKRGVRLLPSILSFILITLFYSTTQVYVDAINILPAFSMATAAALSGSETTDTNNANINADGVMGGNSEILDAAEEYFENFQAFAGRIFPFLSKLAINPTKAKEIGSALKRIANPADLLIIIFLGWATVPMIQFPYEKMSHKEKTKIDSGDKVDESGKLVKKRSSFHDTFLFHFADQISRAAKIAVLVYIIDCLAIVLKTMGFDVKNYSRIAAKVIYTLWIFLRLKVFKRYLIFRSMHIDNEDSLPPSEIGRANVVNHIADIVVYAAMGFALLDVLQVEAGIALKSFFAFGSAGTVLVGFASKDLATEVVSGLALSTSDKVYEGETVSFGNGDVKGEIVKMGFMETTIRTPDELITTVPNSQLTHRRLTNISRIKKCQVKQTLQFPYDAIEKLPNLLNSIKQEIRASCPKTILDGSRPFRAYFTGYIEGGLEVEVDVHFNLKPSGDVYLHNRQEVMMAIHRAMKKHDVEFLAYN